MVRHVRERDNESSRKRQAHQTKAKALSFHSCFTFEIELENHKHWRLVASLSATKSSDSKVSSFVSRPNRTSVHTLLVIPQFSKWLRSDASRFLSQVRLNLFTQDCTILEESASILVQKSMTGWTQRVEPMQQAMLMTAQDCQFSPFSEQVRRFHTLSAGISCHYRIGLRLFTPSKHLPSLCFRQLARPSLSTRRASATRPTPPASSRQAANTDSLCQ
jgi:hypothetical protein